MSFTTRCDPETFLLGEGVDRSQAWNVRKGWPKSKNFTMFCVALVFLVEEQYLKSLNGFASESKLSNSVSGTTSFLVCQKNWDSKVCILQGKFIYIFASFSHFEKVGFEEEPSQNGR